VFVNVADEQQVQVIDCATGDTLARWALPAPLAANFPMHLDAMQRLLFLGMRKPTASACVLVLDADSGEELARLSCGLAADMDDLCFDPKRQRLCANHSLALESISG
jgi:hypothetical protein